MLNSFSAFIFFAFSLLAFPSESFSKDPVFILYNDGTWEKTSSSSSTAPNTATLKIQAGLTMQSGVTKPVSNIKFSLTKIGIPQILKSKGISLHTLSGGSYTTQWANLFAGGRFDESLNIFSSTGKEDLRKINEALAAEKIAEEPTDFNGQANFQSVPIQRVYINGMTSLGGGSSYTAWSVPIDLKLGENKFTLSNDNSSIDFQ